MYAGKETRTTVESIEQDYIYNAWLTRKHSARWKRIKWIAAFAVLAVIALVYALTHR